MKTSEGNLAELRVKHLEMIQAVIARFGGYGPTLKNYCITLTTALCGFAVTLQSPSLIFVSLLPVMLFAVLDAHYLRIEKRFRDLFDHVREEDWNRFPTFKISLTDMQKPSLVSVLTNWSIVIFYAPLAVVILIIAAAFKVLHG
jgi:hypothetical protein